jgi:putative glutamine amidotransferase
VVEQSIAHWVMSDRRAAVMVPSLQRRTFRGDVTVDDFAQWLDGLVMHGGADVWPGSYGEQPLRPEWHGDRVRDEYEIALVQAFAPPASRCSASAAACS